MRRLIGASRTPGLSGRRLHDSHARPVPLRWLRSCLVVAVFWAGSATLSGAADQPCPLDGNRDIRLQAGLELLLERLNLWEPARRGRLSVALAILEDPAHPRVAHVNGNQMFYAASLPKIAILLGAAVELERGGLEMDPQLYRDIQKMIRVSCNSCATRVLDRIGRGRLLDILEDPALRFYDRNDHGGIWVGKPFARGAAYRRDPVAGLSHGANSLQVVRFYCALEGGSLVSPQQNAMMLEALARPGIEHKFVKALEAYEVDEVFRKSGTWKQFHADSALVRAGGRSYVMVALAEDPNGPAWLERLGAGLHELATSWQIFDAQWPAQVTASREPPNRPTPMGAMSLSDRANERH